LQGE
jgi:hypothetical protein